VVFFILDEEDDVCFWRREDVAVLDFGLAAVDDDEDDEDMSVMAECDITTKVSKTKTREKMRSVMAWWEYGLTLEDDDTILVVVVIGDVVGGLNDKIRGIVGRCRIEDGAPFPEVGNGVVC